MSRLDIFFRNLLLSKTFTQGWGKPENLKRLFKFRKIISERETCQQLVESDYPIHIDNEEVFDEYKILHGHFVSPFVHHLPGIMPKEVQIAKFQMMMPNEWKGPLKPVCVHLAGTGDHGFTRRRRLLARPLLKENNIASVILENPYYGVRKPKDQFRSSLQNVSDLFVMGGALVLESLALFHWLEAQGFGPLGITGLSMGGHMASLAASNWHKPLSLIPCLSWTSASSVFTHGVLSGAIPWKKLQEQYNKYNEYSSEISELIHSPERSGRTKTEAYLLGLKLHEYVGANGEENPKDKVRIISTSPYSINNQINPSNQRSISLNSLADQREHQILPELDKTLSKASIPSVKLKNLHSDDSYSSRALRNNLSSSQESSNRWLSWRGGQRLLASFQTRESNLNEEARNFMRGVMDECTHLGNFSVPVDPSLIIIVCASKDAYVPLDRTMSLCEIWPGAEVRYIDRGHIEAFFRDQHVFRKAICDSFERQVERYLKQTSTERRLEHSR